MDCLESAGIQKDPEDGQQKRVWIAFRMDKSSQAQREWLVSERSIPRVEEEGELLRKNLNTEKGERRKDREKKKMKQKMWKVGDGERLAWHP